MKIRLVIPAVNTQPTTRPQSCPYCDHWRLHRHGTVIKPVRDHRQDQEFIDAMMEARGKTKQYTGNIRSGEGGQRSMMAYFFSVLEDIVGAAADT